MKLERQLKPMAPATYDLPRRRFLRRLGLASILAARVMPLLRAESLKPSQKVDGSLIFLSASKLAQGIREKTLSSAELVDAFLRRIEKVNPPLNAVCALNSERAQEEARKADALLSKGESLGPLHGVPITIKDSLDTEGIVTTGGTTGRTKFIPTRDATAVSRLRKAGAIILGKTNTAELTLSYDTENLVSGRTNNPFDLQRTPGGSSGGSAAIVAVGGSPLDLATDTAGSIRVPSHYCGVAGLKPTANRVSRSGNILPPGGPIARWTQIGPIARYVEDLALVLPLIAGADPADPDVVDAPLGTPESVELKKLRVLFFLTNGILKPRPDIEDAVKAAARALETHVLSVEEKNPGHFETVTEITSAINYHDGGDYYRKLLKDAGTVKLNPTTERFLAQITAKKISPEKYSEVILKWSSFQKQMLEFANANAEIILCPVCSSAAPKIGSNVLVDFSYSSYFNVLGWPTATVRVGKTATGLPIGIQIAGRPWKENEVLAVAAFLETALGGWEKDFAPALR